MTDVGWMHGSPVLRGLRIAGFVVLGVVGAGLFALAFGAFVMILWNWLMPSLFGLGTIGYWKAFGILLLAKILFGGMGRGSHGPGRHGPPMGRDRESFREWWKNQGQQSYRDWRDRPRGGEEAGGQGQTVTT